MLTLHISGAGVLAILQSLPFEHMWRKWVGAKLMAMLVENLAGLTKQREIKLELFLPFLLAPFHYLLQLLNST